MTSKVTYHGELRTTCEHLRSGDTFNTDAPIDNNGLGQAFSPTDTVATGLASCMLTVMGIKARDLGVDLKGATAEVTKHMASDPRRISKIEVSMELPADVSEKNRKILERTANTCPVHYSLHPDIEKVIKFRWEK
ncbi:MAG: osmotically inducible protein OsmC [Muricauda sp.]|nr:OsmC family protein [Allomuricauda sp.]MAU26423.1 osmotically inducible protein OsmC [Allomuricauda sp.]MBC31473.1 osmotically inducible protein OsmC [Allomuricauda sp.]|tara:strand:- start:112 stop:516 length:405 start_codon:yes stop_codon:yes gene_type:complete